MGYRKQVDAFIHDLYEEQDYSDLRDLSDKYFGQTRVKIKKPDGSFEYRTERLPLTDEERDEKQLVSKLFSDGMREMSELRESNNVMAEHFQSTNDLLSRLDKERSEDITNMGIDDKIISDAVNRFRSVNEKSLKNSFYDIRNDHYEEMALRGHSDSTAGDNARKDLQGRELDQMNQLNLQTELHGRGLRKDLKAEQLSDYKLREDARNSQMNTGLKQLDMNRTMIKDRYDIADKMVSTGSSLMDLDDKKKFRNDEMGLNIRKSIQDQKMKIKQINDNVNQKNYENELIHEGNKRNSTVKNLALTGAGLLFGRNV